MGRTILFITTDQQRYDTLGCNGGTLARTPVVDAPRRRRPSLRAGPPAVGRVHAVALDDDHRPAPEHARRVDERRAAAGRRAVGRRGAARRRVPHRAHRQAALRAVPRPVRPLRREPLRPRRAWTAPHRGFEHFEAATHSGAGPLHYARWLAADAPRGGRDVLPGARRRRWRSTPRAAATTGAPQVHDNPIPRELVPHRLGRRPHDRLARLARRRRRLVLLDELPRPAPSVGSAGVRARPHRLARRAAARRLHRRRRRARARPRRQAAALAGVVRRHARLQLRGAARLGAGDADRRPGARGQRPQRRRVRADRRGDRAGARRDRRRAGGATTSTSSSRPTTASCRATSGCCSRGRTTSTG